MTITPPTDPTPGLFPAATEQATPTAAPISLPTTAATEATSALATLGSAVSSLVPTDPLRNGLNTSEFKVVAAAIGWGVAGPFLAKHGVTEQGATNLSVVAVGAASGAYALFRSLIKIAAAWRR